MSSDSFDELAQVAFESSVGSTLIDGEYDEASVRFLSVREDFNTSDSFSDGRRHRNLVSQSSSILIVFEVVLVLEKTQYTSPASLVPNLQEFLAVSLVTSRFTNLFIETCVALGSQEINSTTFLKFGNVSSLNFTVTVVSTDSPTVAPKSHENGNQGSDFPLWGFIIIGVGGITLLLGLGLLVFQRKRKLSKLEGLENRYLGKTDLTSKSSTANEFAGVVALSHGEVQLGIGLELELGIVPDQQSEGVVAL
jgi:hypothetical protein